jgi:non-specific serine/threonine protein kinase
MRFSVETRPPEEGTWIATAEPAAAGAMPPDSVFRREGEYWTLAYEGTVLRLRDAKGLRYLACLLQHPDREFHVLDLVVAGADQDPPPQADPARGPGATRRTRSSGTAGPLLDAKAKGAYRARLQELRDQIEKAERYNDLGRAEAARTEMDALSTQLARAMGLGGRDRETASDAERARVTVTLRVKGTLEKIRRSHPGLGHHLTSCIRTGRFCSYRPDPTRTVSWTI